DEVAVGAVDQHAVKPAALQPPGAVHEVGDDLLNVPLVRLPDVGVPVGDGDVGGGDHLRSTDQRRVCAPPGVEQLHRKLGAVAVGRLGQQLQSAAFGVIGDVQLVGGVGGVVPVHRGGPEVDDGGARLGLSLHKVDVALGHLAVGGDH